MSLLELLSQRLVELRRRHSLTQEQLAVLLNTDLKWLQRVEWGKKDVKSSTIERISAVFGISAPDLFARKLPPTVVSSPPPKAPHKPRKPTTTPTKEALATKKGTTTKEPKPISRKRPV